MGILSWIHDFDSVISMVYIETNQHEVGISILTVFIRKAVCLVLCCTFFLLTFWCRYNIWSFSLSKFHNLFDGVNGGANFWNVLFSQFFAATSTTAQVSAFLATLLRALCARVLNQTYMLNRTYLSPFLTLNVILRCRTATASNILYLYL